MNRMIKNLTKKIFSTIGLSISRNQPSSVGELENPLKNFDYAVEGYEAVKLTMNNSMIGPISLGTLYEQSVYCEKQGIEGDFVECGVWKGGAVGAMAKANLDYGKNRRNLHLFDAFDDICLPVASVDGQKAVDDIKKYSSVKDEELMQGQLEPIKGVYDEFGGHGTIEACLKLLVSDIKYPKEFIHFHKGWFQQTLPIDAAKIDKIAILRLDGDWYDSIKVCLDFLFDKVVKGGIVVIDDYGYYEGCTKAVDEFLTARNIKTFLSYSSTSCRYFVKS
jgi:O-methyltransferase